MITAGLKYESKDMRKGMVLSDLAAASELLRDLCLLDPRGGIFSQYDMQSSVKACLDDPSQRVQNEKALARLKTEAFAFSRDVSYLN